MIAEAKRDDLIKLLTALGCECDEYQSLIQTSGSDDIFQEVNPFIAVGHAAKQEAENLEKPFRLGVVGMFKSGKSTVLNSFLQRKVLQVGRTETTSVITEMLYAEGMDDERGEVEMLNGGIRQVTVDEALAYTDIRSEVFSSDEGKRRLQHDIKLIRLYLHCEFLRNLVLLDTPGFGGSEIGDQKALEALNQVDAALMIFSADRHGAELEQLMADRLSQQGREVVGLINQIDNGRGEMRSEASLAESEAFIALHFTTLARNSQGRPLIFRYSAKEVWNALFPQKGELDIAGLRKWGYLPAENTDEAGCVITFVKERYFSSSSDGMQRKLHAVQEHLGNRLTFLLQSIDDTIQAHSVRIKGLQETVTDAERQIQEQVEDRLPLIEQKLEDEVATQLREFAQDATAVVECLIEDYACVTPQTVINALKSKEKLARELRKQFESDFPPERAEMLREEISRRCERLLKNEWRSLSRDIVRHNAALGGMSFDSLTDGISDSMRAIAVDLAIVIGGMILLYCVPGGPVVDIIISIVGGVMGIDHSKQIAQKVALAKNRARNKVRSYTVIHIHQLTKGYIAYNQSIANRLREQITATADPIRKEIAGLEQSKAGLRSARDRMDRYLQELPTILFEDDKEWAAYAH